jgi:hypothetical protein
MEPRLSRSLLFVLALGFSQLASAGPLSRLEEFLSAHLDTRSTQLVNNTLVPRQCANPCGYYGQLCCPSGASCLTDSAGQAQCGSAVGAAVTQAPAAVAATATGGGSWQYYTTTWVETSLVTNLVTKTAVTSSWVAQATCTSGAPNQQACGSTCCGNGYYCANPATGQCSPNNPGQFTVTGVPGTAPTRVITSSGVIITMTMSVTTPFITPSPIINGTMIADHKLGLSGGAIAGIVIGVLLAIGLLMLICFCCCLKAGFDGILALFGLGGRKRRSRKTVIEEETIRRHHSASGGRRWHGEGSAYSRPSRVEPKKSRWGGGLGALAAGLGTAFAIDKLRGRKEEKSEYSGSSYGYTDSSYYYGTF